MHETLSTTSRDQAGRRATIMTVIAGMSVVVAVAIWLYRQQYQQANQPIVLNPQAVAQPSAGDRIISESSASDVLGLLAGPQSVSQLMMTSSQDRLLLEEPANLPTYPGGQRDAGIRRLSGGIVEETVFWHHAKISPTDLKTFYHQSIIQAGFHPYPSRKSPENAIINQLYVRSHSPPSPPPSCPSSTDAQTRSSGQPSSDSRRPIASDRSEVLMLRIWRSADDGTHWMLWLRYPQAQ